MCCAPSRSRASPGTRRFDISQPWFHEVMERTGQKIVPAQAG